MVNEHRRSSQMRLQLFAACVSLACAAHGAFDIQLAYTPLGWSPRPTPPGMAWNKGFMMVDATWASTYTDGDNVRYEAWIESTATDWGSANMPALPTAVSPAWRQQLYISPVRDGGRKSARFRMSFDYRPPGLSSGPLSAADGATRYWPLPAARPLPPGTYTFTCVVTRSVSNAAPERASQAFQMTITGTPDPVFLAGIEPNQVYQRTNQTAGEIAFFVGSAQPEAASIRVTVTKDGAVVATRTCKTAGADTRVAVPGVAVGGPYTVEVACGAWTKTFGDIWVGDLWLISGQSNAVGSGGDPRPGRKAMPGVHGLSPRYGVLEWRPAADGFIENTVGPWVTAAQEFFTATGVPVGLIAHATGSRQMDYFLDSSRTDLPFLKPLIERHGRNAALFLWYPGESDSFATNSWETYEGKLTALAAAARRDTGNSNLTMGVVQLARYLWFHDDHFAPVREAQRRFVLRDPRAVLYSTLPYEVNNGDKIHLTSPGYSELGKQIAAERTQAEKTGRTGSPGPMVQSVRFASPERKSVVATFANGQGLTGGGNANEWFVTDAVRRGFRDGGFVPLAKVTVDGGAGRVTLALATPAGAGAALSYGYDCGATGTLFNTGGFPAPAFVKVEVHP